MKYGTHKLRHELKYHISTADYYELRARAATFMQPDKHGEDGKYFIRSLYLDDIFCADYHQKMDGWSRRRKYRVRIYDLSDEIIKFEVKDKYDSYISKVSSRITKGQYRKIADGDFSFVTDMLFDNADKGRHKALRIGYIDSATKLLRPQVVVDYDREVYICKEGNVRLTFDMNLRAGDPLDDIFDPLLPTVPAYQEGTMILEVKYDDYLPDFIRHMLKPLGRWQSSQSKYAMCCLAQANFFGKDVF